MVGRRYNQFLPLPTAIDAQSATTRCNHRQTATEALDCWGRAWRLSPFPPEYETEELDMESVQKYVADETAIKRFIWVPSTLDDV